MFDSVVAEMPLTTGQLCARIADNHHALLAAECAELVLAAAWADAHERQARAEEWQPLVPKVSAWGGDGCPGVSSDCAEELGALRGVGTVAAQQLIGDALDLRHRLPAMWALVCEGKVHAWQARKTAQATHELSWEHAGDVDRTLSPYLPQLGWARFSRLLDAAVVDADPVARRAREDAARRRRGVWAHAGEDGLATIVAKAASGDVAWFMATVDRIADILHLDGDSDGVDARRAKAVGVLAQPAHALALLLAHTDDPDPGPTPAEPGQSADPGDFIDAGEQTEATDPTEQWLWDDWTASDDRPADAQIDTDSTDSSTDGSGSADDAPTDHTGALIGPRDRSLDLSGAPALAALSAKDLARLKPRVVLHLHLSDAALRCGDGLVRPEHGTPLTLTQLREWLSDTGCPVTVRPVVDPTQPGDAAPVDAYETPARLRELLSMRNPVDVFPFGAASSRSLDLDHSDPYDFGGPDRPPPPGQTGLHNLGPTTRRHHNAVTHGGWRRHQPDPGTYLYRSPNGYVFLVTHQGTIGLGRTPYADTVWRAATPRRGDPTSAVA